MAHAAAATHAAHGSSESHAPDPNLNLTLGPSLHPRLRVQSAPRAGCALHLALGLPDALFVDPAELAHLWGAASGAASGPSSQPARTAWTLDPPVIDVERPLDAAASPARLELVSRDADFELPLHARYLPPTAEGKHDVRVFPPGTVRAGLACGGQSAVLGPVSVDLALTLPAARDDVQPAVDAITALAVWTGWAYLVYKLLRARK